MQGILEMWFQVLGQEDSLEKETAMDSSILAWEIPWTVAHQAPLSTGFSRQEYWSRWPCSTPGDLPDPGMGPEFLASPVLEGGFFTTSTTWEALDTFIIFPIIEIVPNGVSWQQRAQESPRKTH